MSDVKIAYRQILFKRKFVHTVLCQLLQWNQLDEKVSILVDTWNSAGSFPPSKFGSIAINTI